MLQSRHLRAGGVLDRLANLFAGTIVIHHCGHNDLGDRARSFLAGADGLADIPTLEGIEDAIYEIVGVDLRAVIVKEALKKYRDSQNRADEDEPHQRTAFCHEFQHMLPPLVYLTNDLFPTINQAFSVLRTGARDPRAVSEFSVRARFSYRDTGPQVFDRE